MWRRYAKTNIVFIVILMREVVRARNPVKMHGRST
jgi:hypothetical protein